MKLLETTFTKKGFTHTLVQRNGNVAVYRRQKIGGSAVHFEAVIIGSHDGYVLAGASIAPAETYPSSEQWGTKGFTLNDESAAISKAKQLETI